MGHTVCAEESLVEVCACQAPLSLMRCIHFLLVPTFS